MTEFAQTVRHAGRRLLKSPLFTITALFTLAVGIGANTAIFSVIHAVLLRPLPFAEADRLVGVWHKAPGLDFEILNQSPATYFTYREDSQALEDMAAWDNTFVSVTGLEEPEQVPAMLVTDGFFPILQVQPVLGRAFTAEDDAPGAPATIVLGYGYWQRAFGGDRTVLGQTLLVNGRAREIIGVAPQDFRFLQYNPDIFFPPQWDPNEAFFGNFSFQGMGRLAHGATIEQLSNEVDRLSRVAVERYPGPISMSMYDQAGFGAVIHPLKEDLVGSVRTVMWVLFGTVAMVLLIACANVANLFLVRAEGRTRDVAVKTALGAGRGTVAREFLTESVLLGLVGGALGVVLAFAGLRVLLATAPANTPRLEEIGLNPTVLAFTAAVSVVAGLLFGLVPLLKYGSPDLVSSLKEGGRGGSRGKERHRAQNGLVVAQVALALVLLVGSGLMIRSFQSLRNVDPGFDDPENVLVFRVGIPDAVLEDDAEAALAHEQILAGLRNIPGVVDVGGSTSVTMDGRDSNDALYVEDFPTSEGQVPPIRRFKWVMPGYFETMGNDLVAGRDIEWADLHDRRPVVVVTENFARTYWDDPQSALGRQVSTVAFEPGAARVPREIVGVVEDVYDDGVDQPAPAVVYWPQVQRDWYEAETSVQRYISYVVRTRGPTPESLLPQVREAVWSVNRSVPLANVQSLQDIAEASLSRTSFTMIMLAIAAAVALVLGAVGIYGVISYTVSQRRREIGVRIALGAGRGAVSKMVVGQGMTLAGIGVAVGLIAAIALTRLMSSLLFGVQAIDLFTYAAVSGALLSVALIATYLPAQRAAAVDPAITLREE